MDISNLENPVLIGLYNARVNYTLANENYVYLTSYYDGLKILDISNHANPYLEGRYDTPFQVADITASGHYAFVAGVNYGLLISDISDPADPLFVASYETPSQANAIFASGNYIYITENPLGFQIIDVTDPVNPVLVSTYNSYCYARDTYISGRYAYLADSDSGLQIIDINNPQSPVRIGRYYCNAYDVFVSNDFAYIQNGSSCLIIDITDPANPELAGSYNSNYNQMCVYGNYAFLAGGLVDFQIVDISHPEDPALVASLDIDGQAEGLTVLNNYLYLTGFNFGNYGFVKVIDISNLSDPVITTDYRCPGVPTRVFATGDLVNVAAMHSLLIFQESSSEVENGPIVPNSFFYSQNYPNPFNASTMISYKLPKLTYVNIEIFDILGRCVANLGNSIQSSGLHQVIWDAKDVSSGVYFYKLQAGDYSETKKMVLLK